MGQKDAQQAFVIRGLAADLDLGAEHRRLPHRARVGRPGDEFSRNVYLTPEERAQAPVLFAALQEAETLVADGERDAAVVVGAVQARLAQAPLARVEYVESVATTTLTPVARLQGRVLLALAVRFGRTRLIDNTVLDIG